MFKNFDRRHNDQCETFLKEHKAFLEEHAKQFDSAMESQKKASDLINGTFEFMIGCGMFEQNSTQYEQAKNKLMKCLCAVKEDEALKQNVEVQKLVEEIAKNIDDKDAMMEILDRIGILVGTPQTPDVFSSFNEWMKR